jgi:hypothetical protein
MDYHCNGHCRGVDGVYFVIRFIMARRSNDWRLMFFTTCLLMIVNFGLSQCTPTLDTNDVKRIAKKKRIYWNKEWTMPPRMSFDGQKCQWTFTAGKIRFTKKGNCKYTRGCSITTTATLVLDARTGQEIFFQEQKRLWPHHE